MALYSMVMNHKTYIKAMRLAGEYIQDPDEFNRLIAEAQEKLADAAVKARDALYEGLDIMLRMLTAYSKGEYRAIPWRTLLIITAAVIYFVMPLDFIPDLLPMIGFADDLAIIVWSFNQIKHDVDQFLLWEKEQQTQQAPEKVALEDAAAADAAAPDATAPDATPQELPPPAS